MGDKSITLPLCPCPQGQTVASGSQPQHAFPRAGQPLQLAPVRLAGQDVTGLCPLGKSLLSWEVVRTFPGCSAPALSPPAPSQSHHFIIEKKISDFLLLLKTHIHSANAERSLLATRERFCQVGNHSSVCGEFTVVCEQGVWIRQCGCI